MGTVQDELVTFSDGVWARTWARLEGLTDEEAFWQPVPGCWTIRPVGDSWETDWAVPAPTPPPFTTIAWRIVHLIGCYGSERNSRWLGLDVGIPPLEASITPAPHTADELLDVLERAHARWQAVLHAADDECLGTSIGPMGGQYADATRSGLVLHQLDEVVHHAAEVGVLRDLWAAKHRPVNEHPVIAELLTAPAGATPVFSGAPPSTLAELAAWGRWDLVAAALDHGLPAEDPSPAGAPSALHRAAATGRRPMVERLLAAGADPSRRDPTWHATPGEWAAFFGWRDLADDLAERTSGS